MTAGSVGPPSVARGAPAPPTDRQLDSDDLLLDERPPGERYFRHPGDVLRLVLWSVVVVATVAFIELADDTSAALTDDIGGAATSLYRTVRELLLVVVQVSAVVISAAVLVSLAIRRRWRRTAVLLAAAGCGAGLMWLVDRAVERSGTVRGALVDDVWLLPVESPTLAFLSGASAAVTVGMPWLATVWRTAAAWALVGVAVVIAVAGTRGVIDLFLAGAVGAVAGSAVLVTMGAPNRRPSPAMLTTALRGAGVDITGLQLQAAVGGRSQRYRAVTASGHRRFVKVYARDSRDADLLYRLARSLMLRQAGDLFAAPSIRRDVEHESLMLLLSARAGVRCPEVTALTTLGDGSVALVTDDVGPIGLDQVAAEEFSPELLDDLWRQVALLHCAGLAHRSLRAANVLLADGRPVLIDFGFGETSASPRAMAIDVAELMTSLAVLAGVGPVVASVSRTLTPEQLDSALPFVQPLALSAATRKQASKQVLNDLRDGIVAVTGGEPAPLERLVRVRLRTVIVIVTLAGAFYILLPQLADVDESFRALGDANWWWLSGMIVASLLTYAAGTVGMAAAVRQRLPFGALFQAQIGSSFVNRVTPAKVGGMALNVRFMQKAGVPPAEAVTATALNLLAGTVMHILLLAGFFAWAGQGNEGEFGVPGGSTLLVVIAALMAAAGLVTATGWGRRVIGRHLLRFVHQSWQSIADLARSPSRLSALLGGSAAVTLSYIAALACAVLAFDGGLTFAEVGTVYLASSIIAAAAPTPGGLGAMEAALVAGLTTVGMESGIAVAAVLTYRLATFWLPILPGWLCFELLQRRSLI